MNDTRTLPRRLRLHPVRLAVMGLTVAWPLAALAQSAPASTAADGTQTVTVTARFKTEALQDVPIAITAISGKDLEDKGSITLDQVSSVAPNVTLQQQGTISGKSLAAYIRGIGQSDFSFALEPGVGIYMDDVDLGTLYGTVLGRADLDRIEVNRGPQGTLAGKNSEGGSVKLYSARPKGDNTGYLAFGIGSDKRRQLQGGFDVALIPNQLALRVSAGSNTQDGYVNVLDFACARPSEAGSLVRTTTRADCKVGTLGGTDVQYGRLALQWTPSSDLRVNLSMSRTRDNGEATAETLIAVPGSGLLSGFNDSYARPTYGVAMDGRFVPPNIYTSYTTFRDPQSGLSMPNASPLDDTLAIATIDWKTAGGLRVKSLTGYRHFTGSFSLDQGGSPLFYLGIYNPVAVTAKSQELRLSDSFAVGNGGVAWTVGAHYYESKANSGGYVNIPSIGLPIPGVPALRFTQDNTADNEAKSVFANVVWDLTDQFSTELGWRYTDETKTWHQRQFFIDGSGRPTTIAQVPELTGTAANQRHDYKLGLSYKAAPNAMVYTSVSTGFKAGGSNPRPLSAADAVPFGPESVVAYELGAKTDFLKKTLRMNAAVFQSNYKDLQTNGQVAVEGTNPPVFFDRLSNFGKVRIRGVELEVVYRPNAALQIDGNLGTVDYRVLDVGRASGLTLDSKQLYVPKTSYAIGAQYAMPLAGGTLTPRIDFTHRSQVVSDAFNTPLGIEPALSLANLHLSYTTASKLWSVRLDVTNLANKAYYVSRVNSIVPFGTIEGQPGRPREYFLSVRRSF